MRSCYLWKHSLRGVVIPLSIVPRTIGVANLSCIRSWLAYPHYSLSYVLWCFRAADSRGDRLGENFWSNTYCAIRRRQNRPPYPSLHRTPSTPSFGVSRDPMGCIFSS